MTEHGIVFTTDALTQTVHPVPEPEDAWLAHVQVDEGDIRATVDLPPGRYGPFDQTFLLTSQEGLGCRTAEHDG